MTQDKNNQVNNPTEQEDTGSDSASHTAGTNKGEEATGNHGKEAGRDGDTDRTARDSTGVNPDNQEPIDPRMPNMPPA